MFLPSTCLHSEGEISMAKYKWFRWKKGHLPMKERYATGESSWNGAISARRGAISARKGGISTRKGAISNPFIVYPHTLSPIADTSFTRSPLNFHRMHRPFPLLSTILAFPISPQNFTFSLRYSASLRLCVKINSLTLNSNNFPWFPHNSSTLMLHCICTRFLIQCTRF